MLRNSLLADDSVDECDLSSTALYSVTLSGTVLADDSSCGGAATAGLGSTLDPLQNNGGFTSTHALLPGSPAIDAVPAAECTDHSGNPVSEDQRARPRPSPASGACDAGCFEIEQTEPASTPTPTATPTPTPTPTPTSTPTATSTPTPTPTPTPSVLTTPAAFPTPTSLPTPTPPAPRSAPSPPTAPQQSDTLPSGLAQVGSATPALQE